MELLERALFLQTLAEYAGEARQGDGRLVLVSGESGIGKTALLEAFQAGLPDARWLWGACDGLLTPRPLPCLASPAYSASVCRNAVRSSSSIAKTPRFLAIVAPRATVHQARIPGAAMWVQTGP